MQQLKDQSTEHNFSLVATWLIIFNVGFQF